MRTENGRPRVGWEGYAVLIHVSQPLGKWRHLHYFILTMNNRTGPQVRGYLGSFGKWELW